jgi:hypothetical protein
MHHSPAGADQKTVDDKINALAIEVGFPKGFDLVFDSVGAIDVLRQVRDLEKLQSLVRQVQPLLAAVSSRALEFTGALNALDLKARAALAATDPSADGNFIDHLIRNAEQIQDIAGSALASLKVEGVGRPAEPRIKSALAILYSLYRDHCPGSHAFKSNASAPHGYEGDFFKFACQLFAILEIVRTPQAIGKQIQLAIQHDAVDPPTGKPLQKNK